jgi:diguanylate cyclase (GGDEF)-like protein
VLEEFSRVLRENTREADALARLGGEEFVIVCRHSALDGCKALAEKVRERVAEHRFPRVGQVTASLGVASCREDDTAATLLARADAALYQAKKLGRNRVESAT